MHFWTAQSGAISSSSATPHCLWTANIEENLAVLDAKTRSLPDQLLEFLELEGSACLCHKMVFPEEKRDLLKIATSNRALD